MSASLALCTPPTKPSAASSPPSSPLPPRPAALPDGDYVAVIERVEVEEATAKGGDLRRSVVWHFSVEGPALFAGAGLRKRSNATTPEHMTWLARDVRRLSRRPALAVVLPTDTAELQAFLVKAEGLRARVRLVTDGQWRRVRILGRATTASPSSDENGGRR